jgi:hypothetical protein
VYYHLYPFGIQQYVRSPINGRLSYRGDKFGCVRHFSGAVTDPAFLGFDRFQFISSGIQDNVEFAIDRLYRRCFMVAANYILHLFFIGIGNDIVFQCFWRRFLQALWVLLYYIYCVVVVAEAGG